MANHSPEPNNYQNAERTFDEAMEEADNAAAKKKGGAAKNGGGK